VIIGGRGIDWAHAGKGNDILRMKAGDDKAYGGDGNDIIKGGAGNDWLQGAGGDDTVYGGGGRDILHGRQGNDTLIDRKGRDWFDGGEGDDHMIARSDAGRPDMLVDDLDPNEIDLNGWTDRLTGGPGADLFHFVFEMNASIRIARNHADEDGRVNWMSIMTENENRHDHWVDWGGMDKIDDYNRAEGDLILLEGHTVGVSDIVYVDFDEDGVIESSVINVFSDQSTFMAERGLGGGTMAHDRDLLGCIIVEGVIITMDDIELDPNSMAARFDFI
jgi:Ca2+-binding RTX toxin-like protein